MPKRLRPIIDRLALHALLALVLLSGVLPQSHSIRSSADEMGAFHYYISGGWPLITRVAEGLAVYQGRISGFFVVYLNTLGAILAESHFWRIVFAALHLSTYVLFALYLSRVLRLNVTALFLVTALSLHPLVPWLLPPHAYPLQNEVPLLAILLARLTLMQSAPGVWRPVSYTCGYVVFALAIIASDYVFLFASCLVVGEAILFAGDQYRRGASAAASIRRTFELSRVRADVALLGVGLSIFGIFRLLNPSQYDGNALDGLGSLQNLFLTTARHIWAGTAFPYLSWQTLDVPSTVMLAAFAVATAGIVVFWRSAGALPCIPAAAWTAILTVGMMICVTLPVAAASKYQRWCIEQNACAYLDSRISYFGAPLLVIVGVAFIVQRVPGSIRPVVKGVAAIAVGIVGFLSYCSTWQISQSIISDAAPWQNADYLACHRFAVPISDDELLDLIDAKRRVSFHPDLSPPNFWRGYIDWKNHFCRS